MWWTRRRRIQRMHRDLERRCSALVGEVLESVRYVEGDYAEPEWNRVADYDSVDFGVELCMHSRQTFALMWDYAPVDFAMNLVVGAVPVIEGVPRLDVSATSRWSSLIGQTVTECGVVWRPIEGTRDEVNSQTIRLVFDNHGRVLVTASEFGANAPWGAEHVTVFFDDDWERRSDLTADIHPSLD